MITEIKELVGTLEADMEKFEKGNKAAGTRARKACQELKGKLQDLRVDIQNRKNAA